MKTLEAHFDGRFLVPHTPLELPLNQPLAVTVSVLANESETGDGVDEGLWQRAAAQSTADFLGAEPDVYSASDGRPFRS